MPRHQDEALPPLLPSPPRRSARTGSRASVQPSVRSASRQFGSTFTSQVGGEPRLGRCQCQCLTQDDLLTSNLSPRSNTIPLIELGTSLENMFLSKFHSLDNLDGGFARGGATRKWNMNLNLTNNLSLDSMLRWLFPQL